MIRPVNTRLAASLALLCLALAAAPAAPLQIDHATSSIQIHGKAAGLFPAEFRFETFEAALEIREAEIVDASFAFRYDEITSGSAAKDKKIRGWLEAETYPLGSFTTERVEVEDGITYLAGSLLLHGKTRPARFRCQLAEDEGEVLFQARATIDYSDWDLPDLRIFLFTVQRELEIRVALSGDLAADER